MANRSCPFTAMASGTASQNVITQRSMIRRQSSSVPSPRRHHFSWEWQVEKHSAETDRKHIEKVDTKHKAVNILKIDTQEIGTCVEYLIFQALCSLSHVASMLESSHLLNLDSYHPTIPSAEAEAWSFSILLSVVYTLR